MLAGTPLIAVLAASDLERAKGWYAEKLGLEPESESEFGSLMYESGGAQFLIYQSEFAGSNQATGAGFVVEDFDAIVSQLRANGVVFEDVDFGDMGSSVDGVVSSPDGTMKAAWFKDSEGNILAVNTPPS